MPSTTYSISDATTASTATFPCRKAISFLPIKKKMNLLFLNLNIPSSRLPDCSSPSHCWKATQQWDESNFTHIFYLSNHKCYDTAQMPKCEQRNFYKPTFQLKSSLKLKEKKLAVLILNLYFKSKVI